MCAQIYFLDGYSAGSTLELVSLGLPVPMPLETGDAAPNECMCVWSGGGVRRYLDRAFPGRRFVMSALGDFDELP